MSFGPSVTTLDNTTVTDATLIPCSKSSAQNEITVAHFRTYIFTSPTFTAPALGTPASGDFSTGSFTWPTFNQNTTGTAAIATTITAADEASDPTCFIVFVTAATGNLGAKTNSGITFNSTTGVLTATGFSGPLTGNVTGNTSGSSGSCTGNAATATALATARAIYGNNFDGTAALTQIIASTYGGTGNGFTKFSGPTTTERTFTLPDASATLLYAGGPLGTPSSGTVTNLTGTASININGTVGATTPTTGVFTTVVAGSATSLLVGTAGSAVGSVGFRNATSGTATLAPPTGALGTYTVTLPNAASTLPIFGQQITFTGPSTARTITLPDEAFTVAGIATTQTLTNKRITPRVTSETSSATPTINTDNCDIHRITALAAAVTSFTTNLSGTPTHGQKLIIEITDNGTARALSWGASFEASTVALPTTTVISTLLIVGFTWNSATSKWRCVATA